jgi:hypothetical protein
MEKYLVISLSAMCLPSRGFPEKWLCSLTHCRTGQPRSGIVHIYGKTKAKIMLFISRLTTFVAAIAILTTGCSTVVTYTPQATEKSQSA